VPAEPFTVKIRETFVRTQRPLRNAFGTARQTMPFDRVNGDILVYGLRHFRIGCICRCERAVNTYLFASRMKLWPCLWPVFAVLQQLQSLFCALLHYKLIKILSGISVTGTTKGACSVVCSGGVLGRNWQHDYKLETWRKLQNTLPLGLLCSDSEIAWEALVL